MIKKIILFIFISSAANAQTAYTNFLDKQIPEIKENNPFIEIKARSDANYHLAGTYAKNIFVMLEDNKNMIRLIDSYELMNKTFIEIGCVEKDYKEQIYKAVFSK